MTMTDTNGMEVAIQKALSQKSYKDNPESGEKGIVTLGRDLMMFIRGQVQATLPGTEMRLNLKTANLVGGKQDTLSATIQLPSGSVLADCLFFIHSVSDRSFFTVQDIWLTWHDGTWDEACRAAQLAREQKEDE